MTGISLSSDKSIDGYQTRGGTTGNISFMC